MVVRNKSVSKTPGSMGNIQVVSQGPHGDTDISAAFAASNASRGNVSATGSNSNPTSSVTRRQTPPIPTPAVSLDEGHLFSPAIFATYASFLTQEQLELEFGSDEDDKQKHRESELDGTWHLASSLKRIRANPWIATESRMEAEE